jgi:suppressor of ftsI
VQGPRRGAHRLRALRYSTGPAGDDYPERRLATIVSAGRAVPRVALPRSQRLPRVLRPRFAGA